MYPGGIGDQGRHLDQPEHGPATVVPALAAVLGTATLALRPFAVNADSRLGVAGIGALDRDTTVFPALGLAVALLLMAWRPRWWRVLLFAGTAGFLAGLLTDATVGLTSVRLWLALGAFPPVVLVAVLTAAVELAAWSSSDGRRPERGAAAAAVVGGAALVAPWLGAVRLLDSPIVDRWGRTSVVILGLAAVGALGGSVAVVHGLTVWIRSRSDWTFDAPVPPAPDGRLRRRVAVTGLGLVAALPLPGVARITLAQTARALGLGVSSLTRHAGGFTALLALAVLSAGVLLAVLGGARIAVAVAAISATQVALGAPMVLTSLAASQRTITAASGHALLAASLGAVAGLLVAASPWRSWGAMAGAALCAVAVPILVLGTGSAPLKLISVAAPRGTSALTSELLLAAVLFTVVTVGAGAMGTLTRHPEAPVAFAALAPLLFVGGSSLLPVVGSGGTQFGPGEASLVVSLRLAPALLVAAAVLLLAGRQLARRRVPVRNHPDPMVRSYR